MGSRDRYQQSKKDQRAADVQRARARLAIQRETSAYVISRAYHAVAGGAPPDSFAAIVVELADADRLNWGSKP